MIYREDLFGAFLDEEYQFNREMKDYPLWKRTVTMIVAKENNTKVLINELFYQIMLNYKRWLTKTKQIDEGVN